MSALCKASPAGAVTRKLPKKNKKVSPALHYGVCMAQKNKSTAFVCFAMHMLCVPLILISLIVSLRNSMTAPDTEYVLSWEFWGTRHIYFIIGCAALLIAVLLGSNIAMNSFAHLYSKHKVDMELSLPLSARERFTAGYFSGLAVYILPFIAAQVFSLILFLIGHLAVDGREIYSLADAGISPADSTVICTFFEDAFPAYIELAAGGIIIMAMFYTLWVLTMTLCGSKTEAVLYGAAANLVMPALYYTFNTLINSKMYGACNYITDKSMLNSLFFATSPIGAAVSLEAYIEKVYSDGSFSLLNIYWYGYRFEASFAEFAVPAIICTVIFFTAAMLLYSRRKAEDTGKSFAVKGFYYVVLTCMVFCVLILMMNLESETDPNLNINGSTLLPSIAISAAIYIILDCVSERGIKHVHFSVLKYAVTAAVSFAAYFLIIRTGFFGAEEYVPAVSEIKTAALVGYDGYRGILTPEIIGFEQPRSVYSAYEADIHDSYTFSGEEAKSIITETHRRQLELHKTAPYGFTDELSYQTDNNNMERGSEYYYPTAVWIKYELKNGSEVKRKYIMHAGAYEKLLALETTGERLDMLAGTAEKLAEHLKTVPEFDINDYNSIMRIENKDEFIDGLTAAYINDVRNLATEPLVRSLPEEDVFQIDFRPVYDGGEESLYQGIYGSLSVPYCFTETRKFLGSLDLEVSYGYSAEQRIADRIESFYNTDIAICRSTPSYNLPVTMTKNDPLLYIAATRYEDSGEQAIPAIYEDAPVKVSSDKIDKEDMSALYEIYTNSTSSYIPDKECYTMTTDANLAGFRYIPERYYDTLEEILAKYAG